MSLEPRFARFGMQLNPEKKPKLVPDQVGSLLCKACCGRCNHADLDPAPYVDKDLVIRADAEHCVELDEVGEVLLREPVGITSVPVKVNTADSERPPRKPVRGHQQDWRLI